MKKPILNTLVVLSTLLLSNATFADLRPLDEAEMRDVVGRSALSDVTLLQNELREFVKDNGDADANQIKDFLQNRASTLGLSLNDVSIKGVTYGDFPMYVQTDGNTVATIQLPSQINEIHIGSITVNGNNPNNHSFGSIDIKGIDMRGSSITVNFHTTPNP